MYAACVFRAFEGIAMSAPDAINPPPVSGILAALVSELAGVAAAEVGPDFSLGHAKLAGSLGRAKLDARLRRRLAVRLDNLGTLRTLAELEAAVLAAQGQPALAASPAVGGSSAPGPATPVPAPDKPAFVAQPPMACGVDLERVRDLPECRDYWEEPFYQQHFTRAEIGYCLAQPDPRMHLAARWCLKEAVRKCGGDYAHVEFRHLEVAHAESGAPVVRLWREGVPEDAPLAVSLSHTDEWVVAVAIRAPVPAPPAAVHAPAGGDRTGALALLLSLAALGLAVWALVQR